MRAKRTEQQQEASKFSTRAKKFLQNFVGIDLKKVQKHAEMKEHKKTTLLRKDGEKERQEGYPTPDETGVVVR